MTLTQIKPAGLSKPVDLADNEQIRLGTGNDLLIYHDGTSNIVTSVNGNLFIQATSGENGITVLQNGSVELYYDGNKKFETTSGGASFLDNVKWTDNKGARFGGGEDLQIYHDGTNSTILNQTGDLRIRNAGPLYITKSSTENMIIAIPDGAVELYHNNSKKFNTNSGGVDITGHAYFPDNNGAHFGAGEDLKIYHDGTHNLLLCNNSLLIKNSANSESMIRATVNGNVELYYDNVKKLETNNNGIEVHGKLVLGNDDIPTSQISNYSLDVQGDGTNAYVDLGNPFPTFSAGQFPTARLKTVESGKTLEIHSMWGGDNVLYKHIELAGDKTKFYRGTSTNVEIAAFGTYGLTFNGDTTAANALNDYEEGTFTPTCQSGGFSNWITNSGRYTKIGRLVHVYWENNFVGTGDSSTLQIGGLPFVAEDWSAGSMYVQGYTNESSQMATPAVADGQAYIKVITWGAEATGNLFSGYSAWNITYTTSS